MRGNTITTFLALLFAVGAHGQGTVHVPSQFPTIQAAINSASPGNTIMVAPGNYNEDIDFMGLTLVLKSSGGAAQTTITGLGNARVIDLAGTGAGTVIDGFTITGGVGGILITGSAAPVIRNSILTANHTAGLDGGGAIQITAASGANSTPILLDCEISANTSNNAGGGIQVDVRDSTSFCALTLIRCNIHGNIAIGANGASVGCTVGGGACATRGGGGIHMISRIGLPANGTLSLTMVDCDVVSNTSVNEGGGIFLENVSAATIENCRIRANAAVVHAGGGIATHNSPLTLRGSYVTGNGSNTQGGALALVCTFPVLTTIENATIADNGALLGGGIHADGSLLNLSLANSIVWGNGVLDLFTTTSTVNSIHSNIGSGTATPGVGNIATNPLFVNRADGDYHLARRSPCVDAGDPFALGQTATDRDATPRIENGLIDMGADEVPAAALPGSNEDLELQVFTTLGGDPNVSVLPLTAGEVLLLRFTSAGETFLGAPPLLVGQAFTTGFPPISPPSVPGVHLDGFGLQIIFGDPSGAFLQGPSIPIGGIELAYLVPPGLSGFSFRLQGFAVTPLALNGAYAVTGAHDLKFL